MLVGGTGRGLDTGEVTLLQQTHDPLRAIGQVLDELDYTLSNRKNPFTRITDSVKMVTFTDFDLADSAVEFVKYLEIQILEQGHTAYSADLADFVCKDFTLATGNRHAVTRIEDYQFSISVNISIL
jgi:hypothetical protein